MCSVSREATVKPVWDGERREEMGGEGREGGTRGGRRKYPLSAKFFNSKGLFNSLSYSLKYGLHSIGEKMDI